MGLIKKYFCSKAKGAVNVERVEKRAVLALTSVLYASRRDLKRQLFLCSCPAGEEVLRFKHLKADVREAFPDYLSRYLARHEFTQPTLLLE